MAEEKEANLPVIVIGEKQYLLDYADITAARSRGDRAACSPVRAVFTGGYGPIHRTYDTKLTATNGDTIEFGDMVYGNRLAGCVSDHTRGVIIPPVAVSLALLHSSSCFSRLFSFNHFS